MVKYTLFFACFAIAVFGYSESASFECKYDFYAYETVGNIYYCWIQNNLKINSPSSALITSHSGGHKSGYNNNYVYGIWSDVGGISYFPLGLDELYPNINFIVIRNGRIQELHQSDLKSLPNLKHLDLGQNDIDVLEEGLFDYNPELILISFMENKICEVAQSSFDIMPKLHWLYLSYNQCKEVYDA
ncbi:hypothetical protein ACKWTF_008521 [Chironomus riparius]